MSMYTRLRSSPAVWLMSLLVIGLVLTACSSAATSETAEPTVGPETAEEAMTQEPPATEATTKPEPTEIAQATESAPTQEAKEERSGPVADRDEADCRTESITSLVNLSKPGGIAPVTEADWQTGGGPEAKITLLEYGDYQ